MKSIFKLTAFVLLAVFAFSSCKKNDNNNNTPATDTNKVHLEFFNVVGGSNLNLNDEWYKNENGDSFTVSKVNYYISNIKLNGSNGTTSYTEPESYHLVEQSGALDQTSFDLYGVPYGKYSSVTFMIGVDSIRNVSGAQTGALDPANGNFWSWNSGYIMLKFEGNSPKSNAVDNKLEFHCGGFTGANNTLKTVTLNFPTEIEVTKSGVPHVHLQADILKLFKGANTIDFSQMNTIHMPGPNAKILSDNYANMFSVTFAGL
ncbi:MAG: MbnP family protein [Chitinophagaceae bacterium]